jgi:hypothetical protein
MRNPSLSFQEEEKGLAGDYKGPMVSSQSVSPLISKPPARRKRKNPIRNGHKENVVAPITFWHVWSM